MKPKSHGPPPRYRVLFRGPKNPSTDALERRKDFARLLQRHRRYQAARRALWLRLGRLVLAAVVATALLITLAVWVRKLRAVDTSAPERVYPVELGGGGGYPEK
jgi:hypothetical protein